MAQGIYSKVYVADKLTAAKQRQETEIREQERIRREQERLKEERENAGFFERLGYSILDVFTELGGGLAKGIEGVVDAAVTAAGEIGGLFGADKQWAEDIVKFDATQEWWYSWEDDITNKSYMNDAPIVKDVVRGVGQQLPAIALNFIPGGRALSMGYLLTSAGGTGAEEALNDGANLNQAFLYGSIQALIEYGTEKVTAGLGKGMYSVGKSAAKSVGKVAAEEFVSEGIEEGLSALLNPLSKTIYKGREALELYKDATFYLDAAQQALVGAVVGGIIGGSSASIQRYSAGGNKNFLIEQSVKEIQTLDTKANNLFNTDRLTQNKLNEINNQRTAELDNISKQLQSMSQDERKTAIKKYGLSSMFDENGSIIANNTEVSQNVATGEQTAEQQQNTARKPLISDNIEAYSPSLRNTKLVFAPTSNQLTQAARDAKRFIGSLNPNAKIVITESLFENTNAFYDTNSKIFYFTNNATTQEIVGHEFTHSLEGTKAYKALADYILSNTENLDERLANKIEQYKDVNTEFKQGESGENVALYEAQTEIVAEEMGRVLSDQAFMERIINKNKGVAYKIWQWIKDAVAKVTKRGKTGEMYNYLRHVENLFIRAIKNSTGGISLSQVAAIEEFERQGKDAENTASGNVVEERLSLTTNAITEESRSFSVDNYSEKQYNNFGWVRANDIISSRQWTDFNSKFAQAKKGNGQFVKTKSGDFIIPVNDMAGEGFGVDNVLIYARGSLENPIISKIVKINLASETDIDIIRRQIYDAETKSWTRESDIVRDYYESELVREFSISDFQNYQEYKASIRERSGGQESRGTDRTHQQKQNRSRNNKSNGENVGNKRYSLKDSDGNELSEEQVKFFKDSKVRDYDDNDIRYSLKDGEGDYNYSKGQIAKYVAEHSKVKAYTRTDAEQIVNTIVSNQLAFGEKYGEISGKTKNKVIDILWHGLNTKDEGFRAGVALDIADYIINNAVMEDMFANEVNESEMYIVNSLRNYLHNVDLDGIKGEIKYHYDDNNSPYLLWGKRKGTVASSPDVIAQELREIGINFNSSNPADIFIEMDEMYRNAVKSLKKTAKAKLNSVVSADDLQALRQSIAREILQGYDETGHKTRFAETIEKYTNKISELKKAIKDIKAYNLAKNNVISTIERLRDEFIKSKPAGWKVPQQVADFVKKIAKVETWRNNISKTAREYLKEMQFQIDTVLDKTQQEIYPFRETLQELASGNGELTTEELKTLDIILKQFSWQLRNYDKVTFEGKEQSNTELATQGVNESRQAQGILRSRFRFLTKFKNSIYINPYDRMAQMGLGRKDSIAMRLYAEMLEGDRKRANFVKEANYLFADFNKTHKNYLNELQSQMTIGDGDNKLTLTKRQALSLYATSLREQGRSHLFNINDNEGVIRLLDNKYSTRGNMAEAFEKGQDVRITKSMINDIKQQLTATDNEYMELIKKFFNENSKNAKKVTDQQLYGITNIEDGYYFPIKVSNDKIYTEAGQNNNNVNQYVLEMGMNKSIKPNAQNKIVIDGIDNVLANHIQNMSLYYGFAIPLTAYNRIMNKQVLSSAGQDTTSNMRAEILNFDAEFNDYMDQLWRDIQGIPSGKESWINKLAGGLLSKIRWAGANSALGANPKVLVTQTLSLAAAVAEFNPKYIAKGMTHFFGEKQKVELAKYSSLMWERMQIGNSIDIADIRQIGKEIGAWKKPFAKFTKAINAFTTKPISWMDSNVIQSLWYAAQYEVADTKGKGFEFGTEANKIEAGKRLDEVVFRTQQTSDALGRSEWMRSQNEIVKFARMFTGDAVQLTGRLISSVDKYLMARKMIRSGDTELVQQGQSMLKEAKIGVAKSASAFLLNQVLLLAVAMAFKWIKGKKDEEEWNDIAQNEVIANLVGLLPLGGDIYDIILGYEPTNMAYTALSNLVDIGTDMYEGFKAIINGDYIDSVKRNAAFRKSVINIGRLTGIPAQNLESYIWGVIGKISPARKEQYDALFKTKTNTNYLNKIRQATENGDEELADTIINIMFDSKTGKIRNDKVLAVTRDLIEKGYDVLPKSINKTISYDGTQYTLTNRQYQQFKKIYSQATDAVKSMVNNVSFRKLDDEAKAKAMTFVYDYYYDLALEDMLGVDLQEKNLLFAEAIPIEMLAMAVAQAGLYEADKDKKGNSIMGSKKAKIQVFVQSLRLTATQKYMIMGYLGYTNKLGDRLVKSYIQRLKLTKEQKAQLYAWSGYAAA